jgi:5-methylcytosine-specific restriction endonuclease McrA
MQLDIFSGGVSSSAVKGKRWRLHTRSRIKASYKCQGCGIRFHPKKGDRLKFCTQECSQADRKRIATEARAVRKAEYERWLSEQRAIWAAKRAEREARLLAAKEARELKHSQKLCRFCSNPRGPRVEATWWADGFCSSVCRGRHHRAIPTYRVHKRSWRKADKAKKRGVTVEVFDPLEVLERDGWRCHLCGYMTRKAMRGTYHPKTPELDHIVPISKGGEHSRRNTACACRSCNQTKLNRSLGQLRLIG